MMAKQILTLENLYQFFVEQNKTINFSSKTSGTPIVVTTNGFFEAVEDDMPGMLKLKLKVCHTETNRNGSHISKENMENAMPTLKYRPILAYIHELPDGNKDFYSHNMEIVENEDGETEINYIEKQVGCFTADDPWLEYDKDMDKTYVMAYAVIPENYTESADIIRRKNGTKVSCELVIDELAYNAKEKYLDLTDFYFGGCTLLGCDEDGNEIGEGMLGSRADIEEFCYKKPVFTYQDKMIEVLEKLNTTLSNFNKSNSEEGGNENMDNFETEIVEEVVEVVAEEEVVEDEVVEETVVEEEPEVEETPVSEDGDDEIVEEEKFTRTFTLELSHDDIRCALYNLIAQYEEEDNEWYGIRSVYDNYFYMQGWCTNKLYKVGYSVDGENVSLAGERQEMFEIIVSESEKLAIDKMREDYAALEAKYNELQEFKATVEAAELHSAREAVLNSEEYAILAEDEKFKQLAAEMDNYSVDALKEKADLVYAAFAKSSGMFAVKKTDVKTGIAFNFNNVEEKSKKPYGDLFD